MYQNTVEYNLNIQQIAKIYVLTLLLIYLNIHQLENVSLYREPQLQVAENYSYLFNFFIYLQILMFRHTFHSQEQWFGWLIKQIKKRQCRERQKKS